MRHAVALVLAISFPARSAPAQLAPAPAIRYRAGWGDVVSVVAAGGLYFLPGAIGMPSGPPSCAPCDPATVPGIDRWAINPFSRPAELGSDVGLGVVGVWAAVSGLRGLPAEQWHGNFAMFANAASWTAALGQWGKVLIRRKRPVLYTSGAAAAAPDRDNQQSMPGLHTAFAFAAATSYFVMAGREHLPHRARNSLLLYAGALGIGVLRVAAGKHFPTDIAAGATLGSLVGWLAATFHPSR
jgi:membrane-associated phospholipid phosphatase